MDCSDEIIEEKLEICRNAVIDAIGTSKEAQELKSKAIQKFEEALVPSFKCGKGIISIVIACKPPVAIPKSCADALIDLPDTAKNCQKAFVLFAEVLKLIDQATFLLNRVTVSFDEQGGLDAAAHLKGCNDNRCYNAQIGIEDYVKNETEALARWKREITEYRDGLKNAQEQLEACKKSETSCGQVVVPEPPKAPDIGDLPNPLG